MERDLLLCIAHDEGWELVMDKPENRLLRFERGDFRIDIWTSTCTIGLQKCRGKMRGDFTYFKSVHPDKVPSFFESPEKKIDNLKETSRNRNWG